MTEFKRACILVVENHVLIRNFICTILNKEGHLVLAAANDAEALKLSRTFIGDIRLLIAKSAGLAGTIAEERPGTRIILLSASMSSALKEIVQRVHSIAFLQHAEFPRKLRDFIQRALTDENFGDAFVEV